MNNSILGNKKGDDETMEKVKSDRLNLVTGGTNKTKTATTATTAKQPRMFECPNCHRIFEADVMEPSAKCPDCSYVIEFKG